MKLLFFICFCSVITFAQERIEPNPIAIQLAKGFTKDIFDLNGVDIMQPSVTVINSVSNDRFYQSAYVPRGKNKFYVRVELNGMFGNVPNSMKSFKPELPMTEFSLGELIDPANGWVSIGLDGFNIQDTAGMVSYIFKSLLYDGVNEPAESENKIKVPEKASTLLGKKNNDAIVIPQGGLANLARRRFDDINAQSGGLFSIPKEIEDEVIELLNSIPTYYSLSQGGNINNLLVGVPQFTIGSFYGTEMTLRFVPALNYGEEFGRFSFWGVGITHNFSQYFYEEEQRDNWQLAAQIAFQGSKLTNEVGVTSSQFESNANFFNVNIRTSKMVKNWFEFFAGFSYETINIDNSFTYFLPVETQAQLGLLPYIYDENGDRIGIASPDPENGYPGDTEPQKTSLKLSDNNFKISFGLNKEVGDFSFFAGYSVSRFNIATFGVAYTIR
jgi:hypothetical protein